MERVFCSVFLSPDRRKARRRKGWREKEWGLETGKKGGRKSQWDVRRNMTTGTEVKKKGKDIGSATATPYSSSSITTTCTAPSLPCFLSSSLHTVWLDVLLWGIVQEGRAWASSGGEGWVDGGGGGGGRSRASSSRGAGGIAVA
ncbi:hypothetical protein INR49_012667 [Caranx melampygus]|nr:hypothetical protein INR49_012667 [Caranx melampygus]